MAAKQGRRRQDMRQQDTRPQYVSGTAARQPKPQYVSESAARQSKPQIRQTPRSVEQVVIVRRNQEKALQMDLPYVILLTVAAVCALYLCISYLRLQSSITARLKVIENLEQQIETLREDNDALETKINTSVDLDYVYKVATEELGMVYANRNQVRLYDKTESEYVRQYEDVPER
jgi:cell division protein FtsB